MAVLQLSSRGYVGTSVLVIAHAIGFSFVLTKMLATS